MTIWLSAGEPSGDRWGARLAQALWKCEPKLRIVGMGGQQMRSAGVDAFAPPGGGIMGFTEPILRVGAVVARYRRATALLGREPPAAAVVIDYPGFHLRFLKRVRERGIPAVYVIPPQVWAWRPERAKLVAALCHRVVTAFEWERPWYTPWMSEEHVLWCGHPLADHVAEISTSSEAPDGRPLALLPGSRRAEIMRLAPLMAAASRRLQIPAAFAADREETLSCMRDAVGGQFQGGFGFVQGRTIEVMREARAAVVCAGTATLEAASLGVPTVVVYRTDWLTYRIARRFVGIPWVGLPNIVLGRAAYPELVQDDLDVRSLTDHLRRVLSTPPERWQALGRELRAHLGPPGVFDRIASVVLSVASEA